MKNADARIALALERIADALERQNRALLFPWNDNKVTTFEGRENEVVQIRLADPVEVCGEVTTMNGDR